jgi:hypothetical protein
MSTIWAGFDDGVIKAHPRRWKTWTDVRGRAHALEQKVSLMEHRASMTSRRTRINRLKLDVFIPASILCTIWEDVEEIVNGIPESKW